MIRIRNLTQVTPNRSIPSPGRVNQPFATERGGTVAAKPVDVAIVG